MSKKVSLRLYIVRYYKESILKVETLGLWAYDFTTAKRAYILSDKSVISIERESNMGIVPKQ